MTFQYDCQFTVNFASIPVARRAAYRNAIYILAEILLELEQQENATEQKESTGNFSDSIHNRIQESYEMATVEPQENPLTNISQGDMSYAHHLKNANSYQEIKNIALPGSTSR